MDEQFYNEKHAEAMAALRDLTLEVKALHATLINQNSRAAKDVGRSVAHAMSKTKRAVR